MFEIVRYTADKAGEWNRFVAQSKNGTFLFDRNYMDYHADRFHDHSLMFYAEGKLYALLPANDDGKGTLFSHQGLTYGGLVMSVRCKTAKVCQLLKELNDYLSSQGFSRVVYKHIPWIYGSLPCEEDLYAMSNICHASIASRDVASVIFANKTLPFSSSRKYCVNKGRKQGLQVGESNDWAGYWQILEENLWTHHHAHPVHSLSEMQLLKSRFPDNIRLFTVRKDQQLLGGTVLYTTPLVAKTQYMSANDEGKSLGALDVLFDNILTSFPTKGYAYFDFGTSNLKENDDLNESLIFQKEGFGGRAVCYDTYEWKL